MTTLILYNGPIYTLNPEQPQARAIAVRDGRILAVGSEGKVQAAAGSRAETINLSGRAVIPGLTDAHVHITWQGLLAQQVRLADTHSLAEALQRIAAGAKNLLPGAWLRGGGWSHTAWGGQWPTRTDLDRVCPDRPALLVRKDGHSTWVNSKALELAGITAATPDPAGGQIQRDRDGEPTGILLETAQALVRDIVTPPNTDERLKALRLALHEALSYGLTSLHIPPGTNPNDGREALHDLKLLRERGELSVRCLAHLAATDLDAAIALGVRSGLGDAWLRIGGLKIFADGSLGSETAEMLTHYEGRRHLGIATISVEELNDLVLRANQAGISVVIHAIGDAANRKVLDAIEGARNHIKSTAARAENATPGSLSLPNRIEHAQIVHPKDIGRFAALNVIASMQPIHATSDMQTADELWGARCATAYALRTLHEAGATLAFGSDAPVESLNPWLGIHAAVTRQRTDATPPGGWYPEQSLSLMDTFRGFCIGPAIASGEASDKGMLAPGMLGDLAVLTMDPFEMNQANLHTISVDMTIVDGKIIFERPT
ncbi:MAG: amidohydrolase [Chloroflexales bacterium]|nr:amidohydrolase [Chloroflexales bacterium]